MSLGKLLFVLYASLACHLAQARSDEEPQEMSTQLWSELAKIAQSPGEGLAKLKEPEREVDHFLRSVREVLEAKTRRNTERDHYLRTLRSDPTNARDHYLRSLRYSAEAKPMTRDHYLRSLRSSQEGTPSTRDHYLRSLRSAADEARPATRDHYLRSLREEATRDHYLRSLRSYQDDL